MSKWMSLGCLSIVAGALLFGGCAANVDSDGDGAISEEPAAAQDALGFAQPDLKPVGQAVCNGFWVRNQGFWTAGASTLRVKYSWQIAPGIYDTWTEYFSVPSLAAGAQHFIYYYPEACFDADNDCDYVMTADYSNVVAESNEGNNALTTSCHIEG